MLYKRVMSGIVDFSVESYINARVSGMTPRGASKIAGYTSHRDYLKLEEDPYVMQRLREAQTNGSREAYYTRDKVLEVTEEAINVARISADAGSMIRGVQEINKMQGYYAPETKHMTLDVEQNVRVQQIQEMSEEELLERLGKEQPYIDAEFQELSEDE